MRTAGLALALLLPGCAALGAGALQSAAARAQGPAIVALEAAAAEGFARDRAALAGATADEAAAIAGKAHKVMAGLAVARLAYDATLGRHAPAGEAREVAAARGATDAAYAELVAALPVVPTSA